MTKKPMILLFAMVFASSLLTVACDGHTSLTAVSSQDTSSSQAEASTLAPSALTASSASSALDLSDSLGTDVLKQGDSGATVAALQKQLIALGYSCGADGISGTFGRDTRVAVMDFQGENNLTVDGVVGEKTRAALVGAVDVPSGTSSAVSDVNPYFFADTTTAVYHGTFAFDSMSGELTQDVSMKVEKQASFPAGLLYHLTLGAISGVPDSRLNLGYYFVQPDRILYIQDTGDNIQNLKTNGTVPSGSQVVCQQDALPDALSYDDRGRHQIITVYQDKRRFSTYKNDGSTAYYESITWQRGKGIVEFTSGYGGGRDSMDVVLK